MRMRAGVWAVAMAVTGVLIGVTIGHAEDTKSASSTSTSSGPTSATAGTSSTGAKTGLSPKITTVSSVAMPTVGKASSNQPATGTSSSPSKAAPPPSKAPATPKSTSRSPSAHRATPAKANAPPPRRAKPQTPPPSSKKEDSQSSAPTGEGSVVVEGSIAAVDLAASPPSLQVTLANGKVLTLAVESSTAIVKNDAPARLEDLKVSERAKVRFAMQGGQHIAKSLDVTGSPSSSSPASDSSTAAPTNAPPSP